MKLNQLISEWQNQKMPQPLKTETFAQLAQYNENVKGENLRTTYYFAATIFILGAIVMPFIEDTKLLTIIGLMWFVMGFQAIALWARQIEIKQSIIAEPAKYVRAQMKRLQYQLLVTNVFMPIYILLIGLLSSFYLYNLLFPFIGTSVFLGIGLMWVFYVIIFVIAWRKQNAYNQEFVVPNIEELKHVEQAYQKGF